MDEPFSHLDELTAAELRRELSSMWNRDRVRRTVVFVTHDIHEAALLGQEVVMLTHRPARVCHREVIDLPWPRDPTDERGVRHRDQAAEDLRRVSRNRTELAG